MIRVIDFETTGFLRTEGDPKQPGITQIGVLDLDNSFNELRALETYINPNIPLDQWSQNAIEVTGITPQMVAAAPTFDQFFDQFCEIILGSRYWVGYGSNFDRMALWFQLVRYNLTRRFPWPSIEVDIMQNVSDHLGRRPDKNSSRWNLSLAYRTIFGAPFEGAHGALADCRATAAIMRKIVPPSRFAGRATIPIARPSWAIEAPAFVAPPPSAPWPKPRIVD